MHFKIWKTEQNLYLKEIFLHKVTILIVITYYFIYCQGPLCDASKSHPVMLNLGNNRTTSSVNSNLLSIIIVIKIVLLWFTG